MMGWMDGFIWCWSERYGVFSCDKDVYMVFLSVYMFMRNDTQFNCFDIITIDVYVSPDSCLLTLKPWCAKFKRKLAL